MSDNPFDDALSEAESDAQSDAGDAEGQASGFDVDDYLAELAADEPPKEKTIGVAVNQMMHAFFHELSEAEEIDFDPRESIREHLRTLAQRHPEIAERAAKKVAVDRGEL